MKKKWEIVLIVLLTLSTIYFALNYINVRNKSIQFDAYHKQQAQDVITLISSMQKGVSIGESDLTKATYGCIYSYVNMLPLFREISSDDKFLLSGLVDYICNHDDIDLNLLYQIISNLDEGNSDAYKIIQTLIGNK